MLLCDIAFRKKQCFGITSLDSTMSSMLIVCREKKYMQCLPTMGKRCLQCMLTKKKQTQIIHTVQFVIFIMSRRLSPLPGLHSYAPRQPFRWSGSEQALCYGSLPSQWALHPRHQVPL